MSSKGKKIKIKYFSWQRLVIFLIIVAIVTTIGFVFKQPIESAINSTAQIDTDTTKIDDNGLSVHFIDVGQGDSIAIKFPDGKKMLVDAGTASSQKSLVNYLNNQFFKNADNIFDYVLLTHSDADHCGGMAYICQNFVINTIYRPYIYSKYSKDAINFDETNGDSTHKTICDSKTYYSTISAFNSEIASDGTNAKIIWTDIASANSTDRIFGANYSIDFYAPTKTYITQSAGTIANDYSPIMVLNYNGKKIMLTGDASTTSETLAMQRQTLPDVDLLKVGHHGSKTSSGQQFLNQIKPEIAVISVGKNNKYYHPTQEALNRLNSVGAKIYRTDKNGTIIANVTSQTGELNIYVGVASNMVYIYVEYLIAGVVVLSAGLCFGKKIE